MEDYTRAEGARAKLLARQRQEPDEDGFIMVTRGGRVGPARQEDAQRAAEKQRAKGELKDFYRWQLREERKAKEKELVRKFEEDTKKIGEMKRVRGRGAFRVSTLALEEYQVCLC
jgi:ribosomal RNA-processing protein 7